MTKKRIKELLFLSILIILLSSCSKGNDNEPSKVTNDTSTKVEQKEDKVMLDSSYSVSIPSSFEIEKFKRDQLHADTPVPDGILGTDNTSKLLCYFRDISRQAEFDFDYEAEWNKLTVDSDWLKKFVFDWFDHETSVNNVDIISSRTIETLGNKTFIYEYHIAKNSSEPRIISITYIGGNLVFITKIDQLNHNNKSNLYELTLNILESLQKY